MTKYQCSHTVSRSYPNITEMKCPNVALYRFTYYEGDPIYVCSEHTEYLLPQYLELIDPKLGSML